MGAPRALQPGSPPWLGPFAAEGSLVRLGEAIVARAGEVCGCDEAGLIIVGRPRAFESVASSSTAIGSAERAQLAGGMGPCVAALTGEDISVPDTSDEQRWPKWAQAVIGLGIASVHCLRLVAGAEETSGMTLGVLALYSRSSIYWAGDADILARHVCVALGALREEEGLRAAVSSRTVIGQAEGILMERYGLGEDQAFAVLRRYSQNANVKLVDVATRVVATRRLPESA